MSKKTPQIRFKGFTDDWEERKSKELCTISTGKGNTQDKVDNGIYPFYVRSATVEKSNDYLYDQEAVLTVGDGVGTGKVFHYVNGKYNLHQRVYRMYDFKDVSGKYFYYYFSNNFYKRVMSMTAKTSVDSVRMEMIADMNINFPSLNEQKKIVSLFSSLDETIALNQRQLDLLKEQKKGFLQKMFPKQGAKVPELRFAGFTADWEERKLEDASEIIDGDRGKNYPSGDDFKNSGHTLFLSATNVTKQGFVFKENQYITNLKSELLGNGKVNLDDIILTSRGSIGHIGLYDERINENIPHARINSGMLILRTNKFNSPSFIAQFLKAPLGIKQIKLISFGSAQPQLTKKDIKKFKITLPKIEEQIKIGAFLKQLDDTIALHQRKLDLLKEQKKGFLQKMFV
ncbi:restriction endonuclease subunit S [Leuconostoc pseudomesenteroides]|uniref:restriction endonuclease subunit S n=1 Tax=Leuconostoc pseudomesenteroides TaxID=33968 RepID=UPI001122F7A8|nr:restriction endonuclease subunit S [Leuconostoc pseudomesenteroides]TOZ01151.1 restriction endonuclease subunit S [Leuconostoc pseudomesenteroides]